LSQEESERQLSIGKVKAERAHLIESLREKLNAELEAYGYDKVSKKDLYPAAIYWFLTTKMKAIVSLDKEPSWDEAKRKAAKSIQIEKFLDEIRGYLEATEK
jgi:hypothetical protein